MWPFIFCFPPGNSPHVIFSGVFGRFRTLSGRYRTFSDIFKHSQTLSDILRHSRHFQTFPIFQDIPRHFQTFSDSNGFSLSVLPFRIRSTRNQFTNIKLYSSQLNNHQITSKILHPPTKTYSHQTKTTKTTKQLQPYIFLTNLKNTFGLIHRLG